MDARLETKPGSYLGVYEAGAPASYQIGRSSPERQAGTPTWPGTTAAGRSNSSQVREDGPQARRGHARPNRSDLSLGRAIAAGHYDRYLRAFADAVRSFRHPVVIGFGHEMNATWYSWGYGHVPAATFVAAWRHVVTVFRQQGADNVTWLWTIQADIKGSGPIRGWWPGADYVTWVGIDGYYYRPSDTFGTVFGATISPGPVVHARNRCCCRRQPSDRRRARQLRSRTCSRGWRQPDAGAGLVRHRPARAASTTRTGGSKTSPPAERAFRLGVRDHLAGAPTQAFSTALRVPTACSASAEMSG